MSRHEVFINGQRQYVYRCEKCGYETDSIASPTLGFAPPKCPVCKEEIGQGRGADLPDNTRGMGY